MPEKEKRTATAAASRLGAKIEEVVLDFSGIRPFEPLDERDEQGRLKYYLCQVSNIRLGRGPMGPKASVELTVVKPDKYAKRKLFREYSLLSQALPFMYEFIKAATGEEPEETFRFKPAELLGTQVAVTIQNEEFEEQIRSRVRKVYPASKYQE